MNLSADFDLLIFENIYRILRVIFVRDQVYNR